MLGCVHQGESSQVPDVPFANQPAVSEGGAVDEKRASEEGGIFIEDTWGRADKYRLGYFLASLVPTSNQTMIEKGFTDRNTYEPGDCRHVMKAFIEQKQRQGADVVWSLHDSFVLVRAFSQSKGLSRVQIEHFALWHDKDSRFNSLPKSLVKGPCEYNNQPYVAVLF